MPQWRRHLIGALACWPLLCLAQSKQHPDYLAGLAAWQQRQYPLASEHLSRYRVAAPYGKSYDVDYLLGTAWCRMPGMQGKGAGLLDWAMQQDMPEAAARQFRSELQKCRAQVLALAASAAVSASLPSPEMLARTSVGSGASVRASGKMYYVAGGEKGGFASYPLELLKPLTQAEYEARIFAPDRAEAAVAATRQRLGDPAFRVMAVGRFVLASPSHSEADLRTIGARLMHFADFLSRAYGVNWAPGCITVYLLPSPARMTAHAMQIHGLRASAMTLGYTFQNDLSVSGVLTGTGAGTLLHELFHLGVRASYGDLPSWLDESLASLYETSTVLGDTYLGEPNWRGDVLRVMGLGHRVSLRALMGYTAADRVGVAKGEAMEQARPDEAAYEAALGRYVALYLQEAGLLPAVFQAFRDRPAWADKLPAHEASLRLLEAATGRPLAALEADFADWLKVATQSRNTRPPRPTGGVSVSKELPPGPADMVRQGPPAPSPNAPPLP